MRECPIRPHIRGRQEQKHICGREGERTYREVDLVVSSRSHLELMVYVMKAVIKMDEEKDEREDDTKIQKSELGDPFHILIYLPKFCPSHRRLPETRTRFPPSHPRCLARLVVATSERGKSSWSWVVVRLLSAGTWVWSTVSSWESVSGNMVIGDVGERGGTFLQIGISQGVKTDGVLHRPVQFLRSNMGRPKSA